MMGCSTPCLSPRNPCRKGFTILRVEEGQTEAVCHECGQGHELVEGEWRRRDIWDELASHALAEHKAGKTRNLRDFACTVSEAREKGKEKTMRLTEMRDGVEYVTGTDILVTDIRAYLDDENGTLNLRDKWPELTEMQDSLLCTRVWYDIEVQGEKITLNRCTCFGDMVLRPFNGQDEDLTDEQLAMLERVGDYLEMLFGVCAGSWDDETEEAP